MKPKNVRRESGSAPSIFARSMAAPWNDAAPAGVGRDFSATLAAFFTHEDFSVGACALTVGAESGECPGEKDTVMGSQKGSDLGYGECDYIEFANVA